MIFYRGYGWVFIFVGIAAVWAAQFVSTEITHDEFYSNTHPAPILCGSLLAAILSFGVVKLIEKFHPPRVLIDKITGREIVWYRDDSLFFIPVRFWPYVMLLLGALTAFAPNKSAN